MRQMLRLIFEQPVGHVDFVAAVGNEAGHRLAQRAGVVFYTAQDGQAIWRMTRAELDLRRLLRAVPA
jgi:hypothetical protein